MVLIHEIGVRFPVGSPIRELVRALEKARIKQTKNYSL